jgi:hypothetical protein
LALTKWEYLEIIVDFKGKVRPIYPQAYRKDTSETRHIETDSRWLVTATGVKESGGGIHSLQPLFTIAGPLLRELGDEGWELAAAFTTPDELIRLLFKRPRS